MRCHSYCRHRAAVLGVGLHIILAGLARTALERSALLCGLQHHRLGKAGGFDGGLPGMYPKRWDVRSRFPGVECQRIRSDIQGHSCELCSAPVSKPHEVSIVEVVGNVG